MAAATRFEPGRVFAGHRIERFIAAGGMGMVYAAVDLHLERRVALKIISADEAPESNFQSRFIREARLLAGIDHPHVLPIYQSGEEEGLLYLTMRLVPGGSLRELLQRRGALAAGHALRLLSPVVSALDALHERQVLHRDVKPENILLEGPEGDETVWLADFGLARRIDDQSLTATSERLGTFGYMAPEQWLDSTAPVGPHTDVYALALVLFEALTGQRLDLLERNPPPVPAVESAPVAQRLHEVFRRALARPPEQRYPRAGTFLEAARTAAAAGTGGDIGAVGPADLAGSAGPVGPVGLVGPSGPAGSGVSADTVVEPGAPGTESGGDAWPVGTGPAARAESLDVMSMTGSEGHSVPAVSSEHHSVSETGGGQHGLTRTMPAGHATGAPLPPTAEETKPGRRDRRVPPWTWPAVAGVAAVAIAAPALAYGLRATPASGSGSARPRETTVITRTATPQATPGDPNRDRLEPVPQAPRSPSPKPSTPRPAPGVRRLVVCAQDLGVREKPLPVKETRVIATLRTGDFFTVTATKGKTWVFGRSSGSVSVSGWTFRGYLKTSCR